MKSFETFAPEMESYVDRVSGVNVTRLTNWKGHSTHPYFTEEGWYDDGKRMLFMSDRHNARNVFSIEIESGEISRLTDMKPENDGIHSSLGINKATGEIYYTYEGQLFALHIESLETRLIYTPPKGFTFNSAKPLAGGKYLVGGLNKKADSGVMARTTASNKNMHEHFLSEHDCRIIRISLETGEVDELYQQNLWTGHINPSPTQPNLLTYCHEGPWQLVDHRIWLLDLNTGISTKIRERKADHELVGHEYWFEDGLHVGYQCHTPPQNLNPEAAKDGNFTWFGYVKYDGTGEVEADCKTPRNTPDHIHSLDEKIFCSDTGKSINVFQNMGGTFDGPRTLSMHDGNFIYGGHHPHPRMTADGKHVVYNSNVQSYCQIYMADIPEDLSSLPKNS